MLRIALIAVIPVVLAGVSTNGVFSIDYKVIFAAVVVAVLKGLDKWVHESDLPSKGIVPF